MNELTGWGIVFALPFCYFFAYEKRTGYQHPVRRKPEKRTSLFEDEDGNEYNPFREITAGAEASETSEYRYESEDFDRTP